MPLSNGLLKSDFLSKIASIALFYTQMYVLSSLPIFLFIAFKSV